MKSREESLRTTVFVVFIIVICLAPFMGDYTMLIILSAIVLFIISNIVVGCMPDREPVIEQEPKHDIIEKKQTSINRLDPLFDEAARIVVKKQDGSTNFLMRSLGVGFNRAERIIDQLESAGIVGPNRGYSHREVLIKNIKLLESNLDELKDFACSNRWQGWKIEESRYIEANIEKWKTIIKSYVFPVPGYLDPMLIDVAIYVVGNQKCDSKDIEKNFSVGCYRAERYIEVLEKLEVVKRKNYKEFEVLIKDIYALNRLFAYYLVHMPVQ